DQGGRFAVRDGAGVQHGATMAETKLEKVTDRRIYRQLADQIAKLVKTDGVEGWSFAAPSEFHGAIVELLPVGVRSRIVEHVKSDLVKIDSAKLASHFRSLQPI